MAAEKKVFYATGRRKTSAARVYLKPGSGKMTINGLNADDYLKTPAARATVSSAMQLVDLKNKYDAKITVSGGGVTGQSEAIRHALARALTVVDDALRAPLKKAGFLRRDSRMVERKKYGRHKARRSTQFSKR